MSPLPRSLLLCALACLCVSLSRAQPIVYEGFGTAESGWTGAWSTEPTAGAGLSYPGVTSSSTGASITSGGGINAIRALPATYGGATSNATYWLGFIGYRTTSAANDTSSYAFNVGFRSGTTNDIIGVGGYRSGYVTAGDLTNNNPSRWAITALEGTAPIGYRTTYSTFGATAADADFLLLKVSYNSAGADTLSLWVNPTIAAGESGLGAAAAQLVGNLGSFDQLRIYAGNQITFNLDEIRFGTSFNSVIPEPSTYALILGGATLGIVGLRRWRRLAA